MEPDKSPKCRVAIIGAQRQRVAKVAALIRSDESLGYVTTASLLSPQTSEPATEHLNLTSSRLPTTVRVQYLPCVATFDSYEDDRGENVRYLVKLEYHGAIGTIVKGRSLAPFFDEIDSSGDSDGDDFPGISAVAIGCGIESEEDVAKVKGFLEALSSSCAAQSASDEDGTVSVSVECIEPNAEFSSMKEENEAFRDLSGEGKKEALMTGTIGPGKMARFAHQVAKNAVRRRWQKELTDYEQPSNEKLQQTVSKDGSRGGQSDSLPSAVELAAVSDEIPSTPVDPVEAPNPEKTRYACKRCRYILLGEDDLENPPHSQSLHKFRRRGSQSALSCQNHFIAQPLQWMNGCSDVEGKLHCPKCNTKVGHYSWTGAQCSCGTWVTPAIMVPLSKVDEMKPISHNVIAATGALFINHPGLGLGDGTGVVDHNI
ncbi:hypothetical protein ACHAWF_013750 [Thalassiosira exigua]